MSLRYKTLLILGAIFVVLVGLFSVLFYRFGMEQFYAMERRDAEHYARHAWGELHDELAAMDRLAHDWASWDDTYAFIEDRNPAHIRANIVDETFINASLNLMLFIHASGDVVFARAYDLESGEEMPVPPGVYDALPVLTDIPDPGAGRQGLLLLPEGVLLVTARPILTSREEGPARGTLIFGRFLNGEMLDRISAHLDIPVTAYCWDRPGDWPEDVRAVASSLSAAPILARPLDAERIAGYALLPDLTGNPALILRAVENREISRQAQTALRIFLGSLVALGLLFTTAALLSLDLLGLRRLAALAAEVRAIGARGEPGRRVTVRGKDELADLAGAVNDMLAAREQAQREREEQEARLLRLAENSPDVIYRLAFSPIRLDYVSPAVIRLLGYSLEDFYAHPRLLFRLVHPEDRPVLWAALRAEQPVEAPLVIRWINRKGETLWAEHRHMPVRNANGRVLAVEGIARDITQQKQAEMEIAQLNAVLRAIRNVNQLISREKEREKLLRAICEELVNTRGYTSAWVVLTDQSTPRIAAGAGRITEAPPDLVRRWEEHILPERLRWLLDQPEGLVIRGTSLPCPFLSEKPEESGIMVRMAHAGRVYGLLCALLPANVFPSAEEQSLFAEVAGDIAFALYSLEQEAALRESEGRFRLLSEASLAGVYLIQDGLIRYVNPTAARMFGYTPEEVMDRLSPLAVVAPEDREMVQEHIRRRVAGEAESVHYQFRGLRKDGSTLECEVLGTITEYRGRPAILGTILDITERKRAEEQIRQQTAELQRWYNVTMGREGRILELKREVNELLRRLGEPIRYPGAEETGGPDGLTTHSSAR